MNYEEKHEDFLKKLGYDLADIQKLSPSEKNHFIADNLVGFICGDGNEEDENTAEDVITMITAWKPGQLTDEEIDLPEDDEDVYQSSAGFYCADMDAPVLNHTLYATNDNLGYMTGTTCDGIPFEAEYFTGGEDVTIAIYIPVFENRNLEEHKDAEFASGVSGFQYENESPDNSIMDIGMVDGGMEDDDSIVHAYVNYLVDAGLIRFTSDMCNGCVYYRTDIRGNEYAKIMITLSEGEKVNASSLIGIRLFANAPKKKANGQVIEFQKICGLKR